MFFLNYIYNQQAQGIIENAQGKADFLKEHLASIQLEHVKRDFPELFKGETYQGKDYTPSRTQHIERDNDLELSR